MAPFPRAAAYPCVGCGNLRTIDEEAELAVAHSQAGAAHLALDSRREHRDPGMHLNDRPKPRRPWQLPTRRRALGWLASAGAVAFSRNAIAEPTLAAIDSLQPGQFSWNPEKAPAGHLVIVVSLPDQRLYAYRHGVRIAVSTCSSGKPGHVTPTGVLRFCRRTNVIDRAPTIMRRCQT